MDRRKVIFGLILVVIGLLLLGRSMDIFFFTIGDLFRFLVPLAFILLGVWLIIRRKSHEERLKAHMQRQYPSAGETVSPSHQQPDGYSQAAGFQKADPQATPPDTDTGIGPQPAKPSPGAGLETVKYSKFLGDLFVDCANVNLQSVEISMGIGDVEVKLHGGRLTPGLNRMIISGFVGDIRIFVPNDIPHYFHCSNFIGDIDAGGQRASGFSNNIESQSANYDSAESKLYIAVSNFLGDVKVFVV